MKQERKIHNIWKDYNKLKIEEAKKESLKKMIVGHVGKYQYIFSSKKGKISCIELKDYLWEIYCVEGNLLEDIERFATFEEAKARCRDLLNSKTKRAK